MYGEIVSLILGFDINLIPPTIWKFYNTLLYTALRILGGLSIVIYTLELFNGIIKDIIIIICVLHVLQALVIAIIKIIRAFNILWADYEVSYIPVVYFVLFIRVITIFVLEILCFSIIFNSLSVTDLLSYLYEAFHYIINLRRK